MTSARVNAPPRVSIVLPVRNAAETLPACLASITRQTMGEFELIAVDDGSDDSSLEVLGTHRLRDHRFRIVENRGAGLVDALNQGLRIARAPLVARMDADDIMHCRRLEMQAMFLETHAGIAVVGSQTEMFPGDRLQAGYREYLRWQNRCVTTAEISANIYVESPFAHPSTMYRRDSILSIGGYEYGEFPEDYELWLRLHHESTPMAKIPRVLLYWRESENRASRTDPRYSRQAFDRIRSVYLAKDRRLPANRPLVYWGAGRKTRQRARHLIEHGFPPEAWVDIDPKKIGRVIQGRPVIAPAALPDRRRPFVLGYVTNHGARELIRAHLETKGYRPGHDYLMVG